MALVVKNPPANTGDIRDVGSIPGWGRSPGGEQSNPLQYSCLEIPRIEEPGGLQSIGLQGQTQLKRLSMHNFSNDINLESRTEGPVLLGTQLMKPCGLEGPL